MSSTPGTFTCSALADIILKKEEIWLNDQVNKDYIPRAGALNTVLENQTAKFEILKDPKKDKSIKVYWPTACSLEVADCSNDCTLEGTEAGSDCEEYIIGECKTITFKVAEKELRSNFLNKEDIIAKQFLRAEKSFLEYLAGQSVAFIDANAGTNQMTGFQGTVAGTTTSIGASNWNEDLFAYFNQAATMNNFTNPFMLSGSLLFQANYRNMVMAGKDTEYAAKYAMFETLKKYFDQYNVDRINTPSKRAYLIDRGALAFVSKIYYPDMVQYHDDTRYSQAFAAIPSLSYDVITTNRCVENEIWHYFRLQMNYDYFLNPLGCNSDITGVLKFECA